MSLFSFNKTADFANFLWNIPDSVEANVGFLFEHISYLGLGFMSISGIYFLFGHSSLTESLPANRFINLYED